MEYLVLKLAVSGLFSRSESHTHAHAWACTQIHMHALYFSPLVKLTVAIKEFTDSN